jgi:hypothetical protein
VFCTYVYNTKILKPRGLFLSIDEFYKAVVHGEFKYEAGNPFIEQLRHDMKEHYASEKDQKMKSVSPED